MKPNDCLDVQPKEKRRRRNETRIPRAGTSKEGSHKKDDSHRNSDPDFTVVRASKKSRNNSPEISNSFSALHDFCSDMDSSPIPNVEADKAEIVQSEGHTLHQPISEENIQMSVHNEERNRERKLSLPKSEGHTPHQPVSKTNQQISGHSEEKSREKKLTLPSNQDKKLESSQEV